MTLSVLDAAYHVAHDFTGGVPALAQRMGLNQDTLQKKLKPEVETHHIRLDEAVKMGDIANDARILHAHAYALGHLAIPIPIADCNSGDGILDEVLQSSSSFGDVMAKFKEVYKDREISKSELSDFEQSTYCAVAALMGLLEEARLHSN